ncbi:VOC family protein [uncultured Fluviicola sp.]|uniref:VOC family protein n=1 Tax=uncultured Fluviicola sp. TaxID=463303 RepID=UPI0025E30D2A|nr:VOC family protein [uncultured Fluviicola sp.]
MIQRERIFSSFSAEDTDEAYFFYKNVLGLQVEKEEMSILTISINEGMRIIIYPKQDHVPATFTVLNIPVTDIEDAVDELSKKGVSFLQYDMPYIKTDQKGISRMENGPSQAWFTDPSKNILSLIQE